MKNILLAVVLLSALSGCVSSRGPQTAPQTPAERVIVVSFDALRLERLPQQVVPTFLEVAQRAACAEYATVAFPSVTAAGHAALWTGAFGAVNGVTANSQIPLPQDAHRITDRESGFNFRALRAEPLWIAAARAGRTVVGHHVTQAPHAPRFPGVRLADSTASRQQQQAAAAVLRQQNALILNGYNETLAPARVLNAANTPARPAQNWRGLDRLPVGSIAPLEIAIPVGTDTAFALITGRANYTRVFVNRTRSLEGATFADVAPVERQVPANRPLARHFSPPLRWEAGPERESALRIRVFEMAPDASHFLIFVPAMQIVEANRPEVARAYAAAAAGWTGNGSSVGRALGPSFLDGGDGTAELRYLETVELATLTSIQGSEWAWTQAPDLLLDYYALGDEIDHGYLGFTNDASPHYTPERAAFAQDIRSRVWAMADAKLATLKRFADADSNTVLILTGDHGMRPTWAEFRPNVMLIEAGLLTLDAQGRPDLSRTRAFSPNGYYIVLNRTAWLDGIVTPEQEEGVLRAVEAALQEVRDARGEHVVTRTWRATDPEAIRLGAGGPNGGDLYYETLPGYAWSWRYEGPVAGASRPFAAHGYPPIAPDMYTELCFYGGGITPAPLPPSRLIDVAPTVADLLGFPPPAQAIGTSLWPALQRQMQEP